jgi:hypothetical protein
METEVPMLLAILLLAAGPTVQAATYRQAKDDYDQGQVAAARRDFADVAAHGAAATDRAAAERGLARLFWLVDGDGNAASAHLRAALGTGADSCETRILLARVERERGRPEAAADMAGAVGGCDSAERDALLIEQARARLDLATPAARRAATIALGRLSVVGALAPDASALKLEAALLDGSPGTALRAWRAYYWLTDADAPQAFAGADMPRLFAGARPGAAPVPQAALVDLLVRAGFDRAARRFAAARALDARAASVPLYRKAKAYFAFRTAIDRLILEQNRAIARTGKGDKAGLTKIADAMGDRGSAVFQAAAAALAGIVPKTDGDGPIEQVAKAFNLGMTFGYTDGYPSAHLGHVILDETRNVEQYGRTAKLAFKVYDRMISNGFESWLWDGERQTGGWGSAGAIVQVRAPYVAATIRWASLIADPASRAKAERKAAERSAGDAAALAAAEAAGHRAAYLPGLADRLMLQSVDQIAAGMPARRGPAFAKAFAARESELTARHSIWIHEGRHALDATWFKSANFPADVLEYRAKLAEILLAEYPRMAFGSIDDALIGTDSQHGLANARLMENYRSWIEAHEGDVRGYDPKVPALLQLDKLSDGQLRQVAAVLADFDDAPPAPPAEVR